MIRQLLKLLGLAVIGFLLIQLIPYGRNHTNPPVVKEPQWDSLQTLALAQRACYDCHSNETTWPWYSNIAPISWLVQHDVDEGRARMNLSDWGAAPTAQSAQERGFRLEDAQRVSEVILRGAMPPAQYLILHPNADLSQAERQQLAKGFQAILGVAAK